MIALLLYVRQSPTRIRRAATNVALRGNFLHTRNPGGGTTPSLFTSSSLPTTSEYMYPCTSSLHIREIPQKHFRASHITVLLLIHCLRLLLRKPPYIPVERVTLPDIRRLMNTLPAFTTAQVSSLFESTSQCPESQRYRSAVDILSPFTATQAISAVFESTNQRAASRIWAAQIIYCLCILLRIPSSPFRDTG